MSTHRIEVTQGMLDAGRAAMADRATYDLEADEQTCVNIFQAMLTAGVVLCIQPVEDV